jgi:hypothetical protein
MPHTTVYGIQRNCYELAFASGKTYGDPFNQVELNVLFRNKEGQDWLVPAYWAGEQEWRVRFSPPDPGKYHFVTICSETGNLDLHGQQGTLWAEPYAGRNPLLVHGPLRSSANRRYVEHADGTSFFWLADLWWLGLCKRLTWPEGFQMLTADRVEKGFSVIQLIAGLPCDMPAFDERCFNEAGYPWEPGFARINPAYFDMADLRIRWLVKAGLVPSIVGAFGFYLPWMGVDKMKQHWRYLVARYAAYPVIWCLAGCGALPWYLEPDKDGHRALQIQGWTEVGRYVRQIDPYHHPVTIHPTTSSAEQLEDESLLDVNMLMVGGGHAGLGRLAERTRAALAKLPAMPVVHGETGFEGLSASTGQDAQRLMFWSSWLLGVKGYTYGANGIWQVNTSEELFGPSPWGITSTNTTWLEAHRLPGSYQMGLGKRLLERYAWWEFTNHQEWVEPHAEAANALGAYAAGIPRQVRMVYFHQPVGRWGSLGTVVKALEPDILYRAFYWNPCNGQEFSLGQVRGPSDWAVPISPVAHDWVLVMERIVEDAAEVPSEKGAGGH